LSKVIVYDDLEKIELVFALVYANKHNFSITNLTNSFSFFFNENEDIYMYQTYGTRFGKFCF
jgi:hypothetical protein